MPRGSEDQPGRAANDMTSAVLSLFTLPVAAALVREGRVVAVNEPFSRLLGWCEGAPLADIFGDRRGREWWNGGAAVDREAAEIALRRRDGGMVPARVAASSLGSASLLVAVDLSDFDRRIEQERRKTEAVERAAKSRMRFFAAASHDLRQPLQALALFISVLERYVGREGANVLSAAKTSLHSMEEMFDALLDMSRIDAGILEPHPAVFMINDVLEQLELEFAPQAMQAGLELRVVASSAAVRSDAAMLTRILRNFLSNAVRYSARGRILMGCRPSGNHLRIEVWDTGPGVSEELRDRIFEEFFRGPGTDTGGQPGVGLGLAIVQRVATVLGHRLGIRSHPGRGSMFSVTVPRALDSDVDADERAAGGEASTPDLAGRTVVVIDDDPQVLTGLRLLLEGWGCRSVVAPDAETAVRELGEQALRPDVILADLRLGGDTCGVAAINRIREAAQDEVPALLLTGDTDAGALQELTPGQFPRLTKPIAPARLAVVLAEALGRRGTKN